MAGRAGRGDVTGEVIVQTYTPFHPAIQAARRLDYEGFCDQEIEFRRELLYPPFAHLVCVTMKGPVEERVSFSGEAFAKALQPELSKQVVLAGPAPAPLARAKGFYRYQIILRAPTDEARHRAAEEGDEDVQVAGRRDLRDRRRRGVADVGPPIGAACNSACSSFFPFTAAAGFILIRFINSWGSLFDLSCVNTACSCRDSNKSLHFLMAVK